MDGSKMVPVVMAQVGTNLPLQCAAPHFVVANSLAIAIVMLAYLLMSDRMP